MKNHEISIGKFQKVVSFVTEDQLAEFSIKHILKSIDRLKNLENYRKKPVGKSKSILCWIKKCKSVIKIILMFIGVIIALIFCLNALVHQHNQHNN